MADDVAAPDTNDSDPPPSDDTIDHSLLTQTSTRDPIATLLANRPPRWSGPMYLALIDRVLALHGARAILPTLCDVLRDPDTARLLGWNLVVTLARSAGVEAAEALRLIARLGNPREVVLGVNEVMEEMAIDARGREVLGDREKVQGEGAEQAERPVADTDMFALLLDLTAILLPRIKTKYPSRFLATSIMQINNLYQPTEQATDAVISFMRKLSGQKRPPLPSRQSSSTTTTGKPTSTPDAPVEPDPDAQPDAQEDPAEAAIQKKLLQGLATHVLAQYVNANRLEWAGRLLEAYHPTKIVSGRPTLTEKYKSDAAYLTRDRQVGQLVVLHADHDEPDEQDLDPGENLPNSPDDIPLSTSGCLFILVSFLFSAELFGAKQTLPNMTLFPDHARLVSRLQAEVEPGVIDAFLALGLWLEHTDKFVAGPLDDREFHTHIRALAGFSALSPSPTLRYAAHVLTSAILHCHPDDRVRLSLIASFLERELPPPMDGLAASALTWLREEILTARERGLETVFATPACLRATLPLFADRLRQNEDEDDDIADADHLRQVLDHFAFHMAALNFLFFVYGPAHRRLVVENIRNGLHVTYVLPLEESHAIATAFVEESANVADWEPAEVQRRKMDLQMLGERLRLVNTGVVDN